MTLGEEASRSIQAVWGLLRRDPGAASAFNATRDGFWRSFFPAFVLLPLNFAYIAYLGTGAEEAAPALRWTIHTFTYVISWTGWPLIAIYLAQRLGCGERAVGYLVAYNWSQLLTLPFIIGVAVLAGTWFDDDIAAYAGQMALGLVLIYEYLIAKQMLATSTANAVLVVLINFVFVVAVHEAGALALSIAGPDAADPGESSLLLFVTDVLTRLG